MVTLCSHAADLDSIDHAYDFLPSHDAPCFLRRVAIFTDKPAYKAGETVHITVYYYNLLDKSPLTECTDNQYANVQITDVDDKYITDATADSSDNSNVKDYSVFSYHFDVDENTAGGVYKVKMDYPQKETVKFFVLQFANRSFGIVADWNTDIIKVNDVIKGKITLQTFTRSFSDFESVELKYTVTNSDGAVLGEDTVKLTDNTYQFNFQVPDALKQYLTVLIDVTADEFTASYKKEFAEAIYDDIIIDFNVATGKIVENFNNKFYYQAFKDSTRALTVAISNAQVILKTDNDVRVISSSMKSDDEGKGFFRVYIARANIMNGSKLYWKVKYSDDVTKEYLIIDLSATPTSPVGLTINRLVYDMSDSISASIRGSSYKGRVLLVLQDKTTIYSKIVYNINNNTVAARLNLDEFQLLNAGVLTVQLYTESTSQASTNNNNSSSSPNFLNNSFRLNRFADFDRIFNGFPFNEPRVQIFTSATSSEADTSFSGDIIQEIDVFVKPAEILGAKVLLDQRMYTTGQKVSFKVNTDDSCQHCVAGSDVKAIVMVTDESAFLEIDKANQSPSLFTKVFLEKEVYTGPEFRNSFSYIDYLFNSEERNTASDVADKDRRLELLLGNQAFRKFFYAPDKLEDFYSNSFEDKYDKFRDKLLYLLPSNSVKPRFEFERMNVGFGRGAVPMPGPMPMDIAFPMQMRAEAFDFNMAAPAVEPLPVPAPMPELPMEPSIVSDETSQAGQEQTTETAAEELLQVDQQAARQDTIYYAKIDDVSNMDVQNFSLPDFTTNFSIRVFLYDSEGHYGYYVRKLEVRRPFNLTADIPLYILNNEKFWISLVIENNLAVPLTVYFKKPLQFNLDMQPNSSRLYRFSLSANVIPYTIEAYDAGGQLLASMPVSTQVLKPGLPVTVSRSGFVSVNESQNSSLQLNDTLPATFIKGNTELKVCFVNSAINILLDAIRKLNTIPTGCFEQASSTSFPLVLALKLLLKLPQTPEILDLIKSILENLKKGINLLLTYETDTGGFEWFGESPGHSTLTAYGLWQFLEISQLDVDEALFDTKLLDRLISFLKTVQRSEGGFEIRPGLDSFGDPPQDVSDIFIYYVLTQKLGDQISSSDFKTGYVDDFYNSSLSRSNELDSYKLALIGLYYLNRDQKAKAAEALIYLTERQDAQTGEIKQSETSITRSYGSPLSVETTALTMILILKLDPNAYGDALNLCVKFIIDNLKDGYFGSTQATILSLYAFSLYLENNTTSGTESINFDISINNTVVGQIKVDSSDLLGGSKCQELNTKFVKYENANAEVSISVSPNKDSLSDSNARYMFSINLNYRAVLPNSAPNSPLTVNLTKTPSNDLNLYNVVVRNNDDKEQGMLIYDFYKPTCYDFNINDLEAMRLRGDIDYFELKDENSRIVFYFRGIGSQQVRRFSFSLYKRFKINDCKERAHEAYLYYNREGSVVYMMANE